MDVLDARGVTKSFEVGGVPTPVLRETTLRVAAGEMLSIVGPSGSGKSTLLYCLAGLEPVTQGEVRIEGTDLSRLSRRDRARFRRDHLGFVFQAYNLVPYLSAFENVALPLRLGGGRFSRTRVTDALRRVGLADAAAKLPAQLSGGQQQRVAIARALAAAPRVLFADEPTGALDTANGAAVLRLLRDTASGERAVVMVTHDLEAAALGDRALVLRDGRIHAELVAPTPESVFHAFEQARS